MKATITRPDGTKIEVEGTADEIAKLSPAAPVPAFSWPVTAVYCLACSNGYGTHTCGRWLPGVTYGPIGNVYSTAGAVDAGRAVNTTIIGHGG